MRILTNIDPAHCLLVDEVKRDRMTELARAMISGQYRQMKGHLTRDRNGTRAFCAAGLACELSSLGEWKKCGEKTRYEIKGEGLPIVGIYSPPSPVIKHYGFLFPKESNETIGSFFFDPMKNEFRWLAIAFMNDTLGLPFNLIGKCIARTYVTGWKGLNEQ